MINSVTEFTKCYGVHLKDASPNVKLYGWDVLERKMSIILMSNFFNTNIEALVKVFVLLFMKPFALLP